MKSKSENMLMSVDCFNSKVDMKEALNSAASLSKQFGWRPTAVAVISPDQLNWPSHFSKPWRDEFEKLGEDALKHFLKNYHGKTSITSKILMQTFHSKRESFKSILLEAKKSKAAAISVFTHIGQQGLAIPGGFISSLIHESKVPVLVLNAKAPHLKNVKNIAFATDFSPESARSFKRAAEFAEQLKANLILIHVLPSFVGGSMAMSASMAGGWSNVENFLIQEEQKTKKRAETWISKLNPKKVKSSFELLSNTGSISAAILKICDERAVDLIMVTEKTGPWAALVLGSVTRDILAETKTPALVFPTRIQRPLN